MFSIEDKDFVEGSFFAGVNTKRYNLEEILSYGALFIPGGKAKKIFDKLTWDQKKYCAFCKIILQRIQANYMFMLTFV